MADELSRSHPGAASSLREGLAETLTLQRLHCPEQLRRTLQSTNPIESMIEFVRRTSRNVKRWQSGDMCLRWTAAGMLEAEQQFRKIIGVDHLARLTIAVERDVAARRAAATTPTTTSTPELHEAGQIDWSRAAVDSSQVRAKGGKKPGPRRSTAAARAASTTSSRAPTASRSRPA